MWKENIASTKLREVIIGKYKKVVGKSVLDETVPKPSRYRKELTKAIP